MKMRIVIAAAAWLIVLSGGPGLVLAQSWGPRTVGRSAEDTPPIDPMALGSALAENTAELSGLFGTDLRLTIGVDVWFNQWQTGSISNDTQRGFKNVTLTALGVGLIPNATLSYRRVFVSASYMWTPDYHFGTASEIFNANGSSFVREFRIKASRQEVETTLGYRVFATDEGFIAAAVGYKGIFQDFVTADHFAAGSAPGDFFEPFNRAGGHNKVNYNGWFVGMVGSASLGGGVGLFGNAAGGVLYPHCSPTNCGNDFGAAPYATAKAGATYRPFDMPLTFAVGYRIQIINTEVRGLTPKGGNSIDLTHGLVVGANWSF